MNTLSNEAIEEGLAGRTIGYGDGQIICDGCGARVNAYEHLDEKDEKLELTAFCATPRSHYRNWHISLVYCPDCDEREIGTPTGGIDEAMITFKVSKDRGGPTVADAEVVDRSKPDDGVTG